MPSPAKKTKAAKPADAAAQDEHRRFWLTYPPKLIKRPVVWEMAMKFSVVFNIRQASVTEQIGILCLELEGKRADIRAAIAWLEKHGVRVEPVEINVLES